jgi:hypothetical protein
MRGLKLVGAVGMIWGLISVQAQAHHELRKGLTDLLGPNAWAIVLVVPVPFVILGLLAWRVSRALRSSDETPQDVQQPWEGERRDHAEDP